MLNLRLAVEGEAWDNAGADAPDATLGGTEDLGNVELVATVRPRPVVR